MSLSSRFNYTSISFLNSVNRKHSLPPFKTAESFYIFSDDLIHMWECTTSAFSKFTRSISS